MTNMRYFIENIFTTNHKSRKDLDEKVLMDLEALIKEAFDAGYDYRDYAGDNPAYYNSEKGYQEFVLAKSINEGL